MSKNLKKKKGLSLLLAILVMASSVLPFKVKAATKAGDLRAKNYFKKAVSTKKSEGKKINGKLENLNGDEVIAPINVEDTYPFDFENILMPINFVCAIKFDTPIMKGDKFDSIKIISSKDKIYNTNLKLLEDGNDKNTILLIEATQDLEYSTSYTLSIPSTAVTNSTGSSMAKDYELKFKTDKEFNTLAGDNRYNTSIAISKEGWRSADTVVLATGDDFPDALASAPLASKFDAPILLTKSKDISVEVLDEIERLGAKEVYLIGGLGAISKKIEDKITSMGIKCKRLQGNNRYETAVAIAKEIGVTDTIVIATGNNYPDALSMAPFAALFQWPILLTDNSTVPSSVQKYVKDNNVKSTNVVGGTGVISDKTMRTFPNPKRLAGENRYQTNIEIIFAMGADATYTYFATGKNFPDALAGAPLAAYSFAPIILVDDGMDKDVLEAWQANKDEMKMKRILGGTGAVTDSILNKIFN